MTRGASVADWERTKAGFKAFALRQGFEGTVEGLDAICALHAPRDASRPLERESDGWYADEIGWALKAARDEIQAGHASHGAAEAFVAGLLAGKWPASRKWRRSQEQRIAAARKGGRSVGERADDRRQRVAGAARQYRQKHEYDRARNSTREMARKLASVLGIPEHTVRDHLRKLHIK